jgi:hypothetical protein
MPIDLLRELPRAALAPAGEAAERIRVTLVDGPDGARPALVMHPTSRVIWQVQMAERAELRTTLARLPGGEPAATVSVRIGVSDERIYEDYFREALDPPAGEQADWRPLVIDLAYYSGPKWSLFYQPSRRLWSLVLNVQGDGQAAVALLEPVIIAPSSRRDPPAR